MKIKIEVDLTDELIEKIVNQYSDYGVDAEDVETVITYFLTNEIGTESGLLNVIDNLDLFNN